METLLFLAGSHAYNHVSNLEDAHAGTYNCIHFCSTAMNIDEIKALVRADQYMYSLHAEIQRRADDLTFAQVEEALLSGTILELYPDSGRGESCLVVGLTAELPIHVVCGWRGDRLVLITVYIPSPPKFTDPWTRGV